MPCVVGEMLTQGGFEVAGVKFRVVEDVSCSEREYGRRAGLI